MSPLETLLSCFGTLCCEKDSDIFCMNCDNADNIEHSQPNHKVNTQKPEAISNQTIQQLSCPISTSRPILMDNHDSDDDTTCDSKQSINLSSVSQIHPEQPPLMFTRIQIAT